MAKEWTPTNRNVQTTEERANEKRVFVRWLKPRIPGRAFPLEVKTDEQKTDYPKGLIQEHRMSIADRLVRKGKVEYVEVSKVKVIKKGTKDKE